MARLHAALELPGAEPVQGALADLFMGCQHAAPADRHAALATVRARLPGWVAQLFSGHAGPAGAPFPRCSRMATRWSVLTTATLDMPRRALRCSHDDAQALALEAVAAWRAGDAAAQEAFLTHCQVCGDTLAFALARRLLLQALPDLPDAWNATYLRLQGEGTAP